MHGFWLILSCCLLLPAGACDTRVHVVPVASLEASWTIDGAAPTEALCARNGWTAVRVEATDSAGLEPILIDTPCALGALDTRPALHLGDGREYSIRLTVVRGTRTWSSGPETIVQITPEVTHVVVPAWNLPRLGV